MNPTTETIQNSTTNNDRNQWNALIEWPAWTTQLVREVEAAGAWTSGIESDKKRRGSSINVDLYGYDAAQGLAVVQVRECVFRPGRFNRVRKDYYLVGHSENGNVFAHPVETPARSRRALETPESCVRFVLARVWNCEEHQLDYIVRQGDLAFVPARLPANAVEHCNEMVLRETHKITGKIWRTPDMVLYCERASVRHTKRQHRAVRVSGRIYRIQTGIRAKTWGFTAPHGD